MNLAELSDEELTPLVVASEANRRGQPYIAGRACGGERAGYTYDRASAGGEAGLIGRSWRIDLIAAFVAARSTTW